MEVTVRMVINSPNPKLLWEDRSAWSSALFNSIHVAWVWPFLYTLFWAGWCTKASTILVGPITCPEILTLTKSPACGQPVGSVNRSGGCCLISKLQCLTQCNPMACNLPVSSAHGISQQDYWSGLPFSSSGHLPDSGPTAPTLQVDSLPLSHLGSQVALGETSNERKSDQWGGP